MTVFSNRLLQLAIFSFIATHVQAIELTIIPPPPEGNDTSNWCIAQVASPVSYDLSTCTFTANSLKATTGVTAPCNASHELLLDGHTYSVPSNTTMEIWPDNIAVYGATLNNCFRANGDLPNGFGDYSLFSNTTSLAINTATTPSINLNLLPSFIQFIVETETGDVICDGAGLSEIIFNNSFE